MKKTAPAPLSAWRPLNLDAFLIGVPHYPEHVDESLWARDAQRMAEAGFNVVRMGEFAWHLWEPHEGHFAFDLFDRAIDGLAKQGIRTILCTPTATPPRWLSQAHPEILRVDAAGRTASHGSRQHGDTTSDVLRAHSRRITRAMATHYAGNPNVIGWQTDNELNTTTSLSFSPSCEVAFRKWCHLRYGTIEALNAAWGGHFWATHYDHFDQVVLPYPDNPGHVSPGHRQDYHRFLAAATAAFQRDQVEILRAANPDWFLFHNLGQLEDIDFRGTFSTDLDFLGFDIYPMLYDEMRRHGGHAHSQALHLDICRGFTGNFIVPEQASGLGSQPLFSTMTPEPGEMRRMALSSVARGADGLMFFRWRPAHFGAEIYWMGLIDHDDQPRRRYAEACHFARDMAALKDALPGSSVRIDVGIAGGDFDNQEAYRTYPMGLPSPLEDATLLHRALYRRNIATGFVHPEDDLSRLKALYVPHWLIWDPRWTDALRRFTEAGGQLIVSAMTATRTRDNHILTELAPGMGLGELLGVRVEEFGRIVAPGQDGLFAPPARPAGFGPGGAPLPACSAGRPHHLRLGETTLQAGHLYEKLILAPDVTPLAHWADRWLEGAPALTARPLGRGRAHYLGTYLTEALAEALIEAVLLPAGIAPLLPDLPEGVEASERQHPGGDRLLFLLNTTDMPREVTLPQPRRDLLSGARLGPVFALEPYGAVVLSSTPPGSG
ncbi:beta-galactosidase [Pseudooceanicola sp. CBS1P-1]|uniref:Beta-galactosidase n=1 Tax=Pseudooceanicola albus TaxID=2692189 RepID=A0A6L7FZR1_9RHOB|nr:MULTISPECIES: beta-galactosidase [Pseudooceanicola]MBT9383740.1 beta-galactosidase [Pseudooceanicola endophyticus]MXN17594.1 cellulase family glycosylhydrolase [Pseudooceanicola albus]